MDSHEEALAVLDWYIRVGLAPTFRWDHDGVGCLLRCKLGSLYFDEEILQCWFVVSWRSSDLPLHSLAEDHCSEQC